MAEVPAQLAKIMLDGDPLPWDSATGGHVAYEWPSRTYPHGRIVRENYELTRWRDGRCEWRFVPYESVTIIVRVPRAYGPGNDDPSSP